MWVLRVTLCFQTSKSRRYGSGQFPYQRVQALGRLRWMHSAGEVLSDPGRMSGQASLTCTYAPHHYRKDLFHLFIQIDDPCFTATPSNNSPADIPTQNKSRGSSYTPLIYPLFVPPVVYKYRADGQRKTLHYLKS